MDRFKHRLANHRFHHVQLQLARFGSHGDGGVVTDYFEAYLVDHFRDHRINLGGHDGRARLQFRQVDFVQASARAGREQAQVVTDFGQFYRQTLQRAVDHHVGAAVGGRFDQIFRGDNRQVADFRQFLYRQLLITIRGVQTGADSGRAKVHFQQQFRGAQNAFGLFVKQNIKRVELLTEGHRYRIL